MERPVSFTPVIVNGQRGWKLPYSYGVLPSSGTVAVVDPQGVTRPVSAKSVKKH